MKRFVPVINKFKETFFDGNEEDPECAPIKGRGKPRAAGGAKRGRKNEESASQASQATGATAAVKGRGKKQAE